MGTDARASVDSERPVGPTWTGVVTPTVCCSWGHLMAFSTGTVTLKIHACAMFALLMFASLPASAQNRLGAPIRSGTGTMITSAPMFLLPDSTLAPLGYHSGLRPGPRTQVATPWVSRPGHITDRFLCSLALLRDLERLALEGPRKGLRTRTSRLPRRPES